MSMVAEGNCLGSPKMTFYALSHSRSFEISAIGSQLQCAGAAKAGIENKNFMSCSNTFLPTQISSFEHTVQILYPIKRGQQYLKQMIRKLALLVTYRSCKFHELSFFNIQKCFANNWKLEIRYLGYFTLLTIAL